MSVEVVERVYDRYARYYDVLFDLFFSPGRKVALDQLDLTSNSKILEIGVGTGASLSAYPQNVHVTGVDLSTKMLGLSERRVLRKGLTNIKLEKMNAEELSFPDESFNHVVIMYVVSVSPNPKNVLNEAKRVCKRGGEIIVVNHFSQNSGVISKFEKLLMRFEKYIGFSTFFPLDNFLKLAEGLKKTFQEKVGFFGYWMVIKYLKE